MKPAENTIVSIASGSPFFCLQKPDTNDIMVYILGGKSSQSFPPQSPLPELLLARFNEKTPQRFSIKQENHYSLEAFKQDFQSIKIPLLEAQSIKPTSKSEYMIQVTEAVNSLQAGPMEKVVLSQQQFDNKVLDKVMMRFLQVCKTQNAYCYLLHTSEETWIGASPELLLKTDYHSVESMALAGTRLVNQSESKWGHKEVSEQNIVGQYVLDTFHKLGFKDVKLNESFTKSAGGVQHICNTIMGKALANSNWLDIIEQLHPTPALGGFPKVDAMAFIQGMEKFDRDLFGGFIGIASQTEMELFVNIRSASLFSNGIRFLAGAGINKDSQPEKEWQETNHKIDVIRRAITI